jgi:hypothetical protein
MAETGLLVRRSDAADGRRVLVSLSDRGEQNMRLLLASVLSAIETPLNGAAAGGRKQAGGKQVGAKPLRSRCETSPSSSTASSTHDPETAS